MANPQTDHKHDWIFRVEIEPVELTLNGEKRKIETIDFFENADENLHFFLTNALKDNNNFELQWIEEQAGKCIGFSENRSNALVVDSNGLNYGRNNEEKEKIKQNSHLLEDLKVDWKNINVLDNGFSFDLTSPQTISLNSRNSTYDKIFYPDYYPKEDLEWLKKRLIEWKENQKIPVIKRSISSAKSWLSVKNSNNLYIIDYKHKKGSGIEGLSDEWIIEIAFRKDFSNWDKLPYQKKRDFVKEKLYEEKEYEDLKKEIEKAIKELENGNDNDNDNEPKPNQQSPDKNNSDSEFPWKIVGWVAFSVLVLVIIILLLKYMLKSKKT